MECDSCASEEERAQESDSEQCCPNQDDSDEEDFGLNLLLGEESTRADYCTDDSSAAAGIFMVQSSASSFQFGRMNKKPRGTCCARKVEVKGSSAAHLKNFVYGNDHFPTAFTL
jgi:hypothetical protein